MKENLKVNIKTTLKASVAAAALFAVAAPAYAGTVSNGNDTASVTLSGHFNKALVYMDNGEASRMTVIDNGASQTRGRIVAKSKMNEAVSISMTTEWAMTTTNSGSVSPVDTSSNLTSSNNTAGTDSFFTVRHNYIKLTHATMGSLKLGHTSTANDGITEFGGAGNLQYGTTSLLSGGVHLHNSTANSSTFSTVVLGDLNSAAGEGGRTTLVGYETPSMGGFSGVATFTAEQEAAAAIKFGGKFGGFSVNAGIGYENLAANSTTFEDQFGGGIAVGHESGLGVDFNYGKNNTTSANNYDPTSWSVGVNYSADLTSMGSTTFRVAYAQAEEATANGDEVKSWVVGVEQAAGGGATFYLGYQHDEAEQTGINYDDVSTVIAGTKVLF